MKSNIGHTESASGVAALIKIALCMRHRMIPPNMHFTRINPKIHAKQYNLHVVNHLVQFPDCSVTMGINNFGMGGNNAHAIIDEWPQNNIKNMYCEYSFGTDQPIQSPMLNGDEKCYRKISCNKLDNCSDVLPIPHANSIQNQLDPLKQHFVLTFSTKCSQSMKNQMEKFSSWFSTLPEQLLDIHQKLFFSHLSHQVLAKRTTSLSHRISFVFSNAKQLQKQTASYLANEDNCPGIIVTQPTTHHYYNSIDNVCFVFSGQGSLGWATGRELYYSEPVFHQWINKIDVELALASNNSLSLIQELINTQNEQSSRINDTNIAQPAIFAIQVALVALWMSWGVRPKAIIEAVKVIYHRSRLQHLNTRQGGRMLAVSISESEAKRLISGIEDRVAIAAINSPKSVTLSGDEATLEEIYNIINITKPNIFKAWLKVENAFHSKQMERFNIHEELILSIKDVKGDLIKDKDKLFDQTCSNAALYSSVTGSRADSSMVVFNSDHWWKNMRNTVLFYNGIQSILNDFSSNPIRVFIEISSHPVLATSIQECIDSFTESQSSIIIHSLKRKLDEQQTILSSVSRLISFSGSSWNTFWQSRYYSNLVTTTGKQDKISRLIYSYINELPHYTFNRQACWFESNESIFIRRAIKKQHHPLLGYRLWCNETRTPAWKSEITIDKNSSSKYAFLQN
ncbi:unnamed protein product [Didymodactylos carnosus]|uniref:Ketosynthase family 3 (KS3) domain-containing protein n=1 Tax=Didymodactylos carnosus TaxID=1234261 RepID=A0A8S2ER62_9BILA|nr:unnamed protein product [Didymodactylos carnosus]CAF4088985.1 unnamed protein product [Didymodactylos carnosus]